MPVFDERGTVTQWVGACVDIDGHKQAAAAKDRFLAALSHELRTPLSPVVIALDAIAADADVPDRLHDDLAMIRRNIELETRLIDDLLDLSRVISGKLRLRDEPCSVHGLLRDALNILSPEVQAKQVHIETQWYAMDDTVHGDPARLQQVFWNLVRNAVKFTPRGGRIRIVTSPTPDGQIRVSVSDTGIGLSPDILPKVFEPFEQGDSQITRQFGGLGLGLAICKSVVDLHGGSICVHSDGPGCGAVFHVDLPLRPAPVPAEFQARESRPIATAPRKSRVLLVEDHVDTSKMLQRILGRWGYDVTHAGTIGAGLQLAEQMTFDAVISDLGLPDGSGHELMQNLRRIHPDLPGIAISGYGMEEDIRRSREAGFSEHLVKPLNLKALSHAIAQLLPGTELAGSAEPGGVHGSAMP
jgi:CheY-like chemotaxis protein